MSRRNADQLAILEAEVIEFRTRSGSGFISTPLSSYRVMEPESFKDRLEHISLAIDNFSGDFMSNDGWESTYLGSYRKFSRTLDTLKAETADQETAAIIDDLRETLETAKKIMDEQPRQQPAGKPPNNRPSKEPAVEGIRLLSESSEMFLDADAESEMLNSLRYLAKGAPNLDRVSKLASNVSNVTIGQQHALRVVRTDLRAISSTIQHLESSAIPRLSSLETQVLNVQTSLNNVVTSQLQDKKEVELRQSERFETLSNRIAALESLLQSTPTPPAFNSTTNASNVFTGPGTLPDQSGSSPSQPEGSGNRPQVPTMGTPPDTGNDARKVLTENTINGLISQMDKILAIEVNDDMSDQFIAECNAKKIPAMNALYDRLNKSLDRYLSLFQDYDDVLVEQANLTLQSSLD